MSKDSFSRYHPLVNIIYFILIFIFTAFFFNPICLIISWFWGIAYSIFINGKKAIKFNIILILPMMIVTAALNPLFNHRGMTVIAYFQNGNPLTLESIYYGIAAAIMLAGIAAWFSCYNAVVSSDKLLSVLGGILPSSALVFSIVLRFSPKMKEQLKNIIDAQKGLKKDFIKKGFISNIKQGLIILSIIVTWALENAGETADSMKSRGFGLNKRTYYDIFKFQKKDLYALILISILAIAIIIAGINGVLYFRFYPTVKYAEFTVYNILMLAAYCLFYALPLVINVLEEVKWRFIQSRI